MENSQKETARIEAFSDGVFAIAITLLALELPFPHIEHIKGNAVLTKAFFDNWPAYLAFVLSFLSILIMWINHHALFNHIHKTSSGIMFANGFMLLLVAAVPYPTSLIAEYFNTPAENSAVAVYAGLFILINVAYNWLWYTASRKKQYLKPDVTPGTIHTIRKIYLLGFPPYVLSFVVAFFSAGLSLAICTLLWIYWAVVIRKYNH
ncbi:TMEM175 family protein [Chitinophagaceae bacterium LB-8]|uniref:TMEM175 family protein n=1 Tax=Paraflavisolibacter caeni TaxID=2982496 RepID=A0A9X2XUM5_9BACT|nr:TMEM175 family protein [Paraflavisolibacter caeni]MCU7549371.1 TMEM175 family protein [Paraflavisolibacter caeni]